MRLSFGKNKHENSGTFDSCQPSNGYWGPPNPKALFKHCKSELKDYFLSKVYENYCFYVRFHRVDVDKNKFLQKKYRACCTINVHWVQMDLSVNNSYLRHLVAHDLLRNCLCD